MYITYSYYIMQLKDCRRTTKACFISCIGKKFFSYTKLPEQFWSPPDPEIQEKPRDNFLRERGQSKNSTTHHHLLQGLGMSETVSPLTPNDFMACTGQNFNCTITVYHEPITELFKTKQI